MRRGAAALVLASTARGIYARLRWWQSERVKRLGEELTVIVCRRSGLKLFDAMVCSLELVLEACCLMFETHLIELLQTNRFFLVLLPQASGFICPSTAARRLRTRGLIEFLSKCIDLGDQRVTGPLQGVSLLAQSCQFCSVIRLKVRLCLLKTIKSVSIS